MRSTIGALLLFFAGHLHGQEKQPEDYGFRHLQMLYKGDTVDILVKSQTGASQSRRPLFLFCQGSQPIPLIKKYKADDGREGIYNVFPFDADSLSNEFHLAIISKPYTPLISDEKTLKPDLTYVDSTGKFPRKYLDRNLLDYYVNRDIAVIRFLQHQPWVSRERLVIAGHSEGSTIAAKIASVCPRVTALIYSGGNPCGRILSMIWQARARESDSLRLGEMVFDNWRNVVNDPENMDALNGDANKATYGFSVPAPMEYLQHITIPVLVTYGTKDFLAPFADYFRARMMAQKKTNFTFRAYVGVEHNFFPLKANGEVNYDIFNWDRVAADWRQWLKNGRL